MGNADSVSAAFGVLLGLLMVQHAPGVAATAAAASGPVVAIEKAQAAATAESRRAHESDAQAERIFAPTGDNPSAANASAPPAAATEGSTATATEASKDLATASAGPDAQPPVSGGDGKYDPSRHRDPFRPPIVPEAANAKTGPRTPLEGYDIGQLKLVGIVKDAGNARAMVEDSAGLGYIVTTGTPIGTSGGVVRTIEQRRVLIQETTTNFYGEKQAKEVVMELPQEDRSP